MDAVMCRGINLSQDQMADQAVHRDSLVLIPGTLCDARIFKRQVVALRRRWQVIVLDYSRLRGLDDWPQQVLRSLPERFFLAGFSLGGLWALELLRRAPLRLKGLAMIASNAEAGSRLGQRRGADLWRLWRRAGPDSVVGKVKPDYFHYRPIRTRNSRLMRDMARSTDARAARSEFDWAAHRPNGLGLLAKFDEPLLIVSGAQDRLCPRNLQQRMAEAQPKAKWVELLRCGHFVPLEKPVALTNALSHWLSQNRITHQAGSFS
jgi:pimeloyl-ACP methyl ester carboxylesterase